ncbi:tetratricopeptide repeat protein [Pseudoduganella namucuonensis]|uniref:Flp pilus assembly protein TadD, contains TPR repeats n=1 Tax=Pseudoduganella namucuonensis TaxID=1035707 RepID=A0A1I7KE06_9BURK|nr:tetratricopeptide repeat protein [Pseudoduganella namucuonensis]SFU95668.1 Flp pilus assembly protein TadD, contains TPR repeats [Pseudoduganella namucuonensis]
MKNAFVIVTLSAVLSACAVAPQKQPDDAATAPASANPGAPAAADDTRDTPATQAVAAAAAVQATEPLPTVELTSDLFYKLTKAELDFKRGQWQSAYVTMMVLAQQTRDPRLAQRSAEMALAAKQGGEAMAAIRLWRELAPDSDEAAQYFLGFSVLGDDLAESEQVFVQRLKKSPAGTRGLVMFQMQQFLLRAKDKAAAFALMERVLAPYAQQLETHLVLAQGAYSNGDAARAASEAQLALRIKPDSELALLTMAQVTPDPEAVTRLVTGFLAKYPNAREVRAAHARMLVEQKQYGKARDEFQVLLKQQPDHPATLYALGIMSMQSGDTPAAEGYFKRFVDVLGKDAGDDRDPTKALLILAQIAEERGDYAAAQAWLDQVDGAEPRLMLTVRLKRAQLSARMGDLDGARKMLADIKSEDPAELAQVVQTEAQLLRDAGSAAQAYAVLEDGVLRYPNSPDLLYDFALAAEKAGKLELMETSLRKVMEIAPENHHAYNALGYSLAERNQRLEEAYSLVEKAMQMAPGDPFIMDSMGWVQFRLGRLKEAEELLRRAYQLRNDPEIAVHLGEVLWERGDKAGAHQLWREARAKDPQNDVLKSTLARLNTGL